MSEYCKIRDKYAVLIEPIERQRNADIKELQDECPHTDSKWVHTYWAPGHQGADILECQRCGKNLTPKVNIPKYTDLKIDPEKVEKIKKARTIWLKG